MKRIGSHVTVLVAVFLIAGFHPALAEQQQTPQSDHEWYEKFTEDKNRENFVGWEGILFYCYAGKEPDKVLTEVCEKSYINANFLAASAKISLKKAQSLKQVGFESAVGVRLILLLDLRATKSPAVIAVKLRAYTSFSGPVKKFDDSKEEPQLEPQFRTNKRSGDLIFWEREAIGASSGMGPELATPTSEAIDGMLKQFFTDYLNAQR